MSLTGVCQLLDLAQWSDEICGAASQAARDSLLEIRVTLYGWGLGALVRITLPLRVGGPLCAPAVRGASPIVG